MKLEDLVPSKGALAIGLVAGLIVGGLVGYLTYTEVITRVLGGRQVVILWYEDFLRIVNVEMGYDGDGNINFIEVVVENTDDIKTRSVNVTAGSWGDAFGWEEVSLLPSEERTVSLEMTPPLTFGEEETLLLVYIEEITA